MFSRPADFKAVWDKFRRVLAEEIDRIGPKEVAGELDIKASTLSHSLAERDRHYFQAEWLLWVIMNAPTDDLLSFLAELRGREVKAPQRMTPEEELTRTKQALAKLFGPAGCDLVTREVYGK